MDTYIYKMYLIEIISYLIWYDSYLYNEKAHINVESWIGQIYFPAPLSLL